MQRHGYEFKPVSCRVPGAAVKCVEMGRVVLFDCAGVAALLLGTKQMSARLEWPGRHEVAVGRLRCPSRPSRLAWQTRLFAAAVIASGVFHIAAGARADTIATNTTAGFAYLNAAVGQSLTTPGGGPWTNIAFNFYSGPNPYATGNLYLLDHEYVGSLASLSAQTNLGVATASGGVWTFDPSVVLQPGTQYWFYMGSTSSSSAVSYGRGDPFSGGDLYYTSLGGNYADQATNDAAFTLTGTDVNPGPLPGSGLLSYLVLGFGGAAALRKRLRQRVSGALAMLRRRAPRVEAAG